MKSDIIRLDLSDFDKCGNIWNMQKQGELAARFLREMREGIRTTYIYRIDGDYIGEISIVTDAGDPQYTIPDRRLYVSRLIVKDEYRRHGIGKKLVDFIVRNAQQEGYRELSIGVDLDNYPALRLYAQMGFDRIVHIGEDEYGRFVKLIKEL